MVIHLAEVIQILASGVRATGEIHAITDIPEVLVGFDRQIAVGLDNVIRRVVERVVENQSALVLFGDKAPLRLRQSHLLMNLLLCLHLPALRP